MIEKMFYGQNVIYTFCLFFAQKPVKSPENPVILHRFNIELIIHFTLSLYDVNCEEKKKTFFEREKGD